MTDIIQVIYYMVANPRIAYGTFIELLKAHPEISVDHPEYDPNKSYRVMNLEYWKRWMESGIRECEGVMV